MTGPKRSIEITEHFACTSANVIYYITFTYCKKLNIGETGGRLGDRFRENLREVERNDKDTSKPVARHFNLPNHSKQHMAISGLSLDLGRSESRKTLKQKFIFQIGTLYPHGISTNLFLFSRYHILTNSVAFLHLKPLATQNSSSRSDEGLTLETSDFKLLAVETKKQNDL